MKTIRFILRSATIILILGLLAMIVTIISGVTPGSNRAITWFFAALIPYLVLTYKVNRHQGKLLFSKNNLALVNAIGALSLLVFYVMHFGNIFKPISQTLFGWPALIGFILLSLASYGGLKERIHRYAKRMKFWKKEFWKRQFHKSFYRVIVKLLPKTGLIFITLGVAVLIMKSCLNPIYQPNGLNTIYQLLIFLGIFIWLLTSFSIISSIIISTTAKETGKTCEEIEKEIASAANIYPFWGGDNNLIF